jgi:hypothetical protein
MRRVVREEREARGSQYGEGGGRGRRKREEEGREGGGMKSFF